MSEYSPQDLLVRLWRDLHQIRTGMLGLALEDGGHAQPMTAHFEGERGPLWFYAHRHSHITLAVEGAAGGSRPAVFHYVGPKHDLYACLHGDLAASDNDDAVGRFWSEEVARWYPAGQRDEDLALLCFTPHSAQIWLPSEGAQPQLFGLEAYRPPPEDIHAEVRL